MLSESSYREFTLGAGEAVSLHQVAGREIVCVRGHVWLTEELGGQDVWLTPGRRFIPTRPGRTVIEADKEATLRLCLPQSWLLRRLAATGAMLARQSVTGDARRVSDPPPGRIRHRLGEIR